MIQIHLNLKQKASLILSLLYWILFQITFICILFGVSVVVADPITTPAYPTENAENNPVAYEDADDALPRAASPYRAVEKKDSVYKSAPAYNKPTVYEVGRL